MKMCAFRDLSVDAGVPHQYPLQQIPQPYQHYLASPRMHHLPRNTSSTQVVSVCVCVRLCMCVYVCMYVYIYIYIYIYIYLLVVGRYRR